MKMKMIDAWKEDGLKSLFAGVDNGASDRTQVAESARRSAFSSAAFMAGVIFFLSSAFAGQALAKEYEKPKNVLTFDLFNGFRGMGSMEYQRLLSDNIALTAQGLFWSMELETWDVTAVGAGLGVRKYSQGTAPEGGYMAANVYVAKVSAGTVVLTGSPTDLQESFYIIPTATVGYSWIMDEFLMEVTLGAQLYMGGIEPRYEGDIFPMNGTGFFVTLSVGLPF